MQVEVIFGLETLGGPKNIVLDRDVDSPTVRLSGSGETLSICIA